MSTEERSQYEQKCNHVTPKPPTDDEGDSHAGLKLAIGALAGGLLGAALFYFLRLGGPDILYQFGGVAIGIGFVWVVVLGRGFTGLIGQIIDAGLFALGDPEASTPAPYQTAPAGRERSAEVSGGGE